MEQKLLWAGDCCEGLAHVHSLGFIHRDVAARNVLVSSEKRCKISDFGLAREMEEDDTCECMCVGVWRDWGVRGKTAMTPHTHTHSHTHTHTHSHTRTHTLSLCLWCSSLFTLKTRRRQRQPRQRRNSERFSTTEHQYPLLLATFSFPLSLRSLLCHEFLLQLVLRWWFK